MDDGGNTLLRDDFADQRPVARAAGNEWNRVRYQEAESGREIVKHDHGLARIDELVHHMAPDIAGAASNQNRHISRPLAQANLSNDRKSHILIAPRNGMVMAGLLNDPYMS